MHGLIGKIFGRLIVIRNVGKSISGHCFLWLCMCDCGQEKTVHSTNLKSGHTKSCGCLRKELLTKHGHNTTTKISKIYKAWYGIIQRCTNPNDQGYHNYGGRGIEVCSRWRKFENFLKDLGNPPTKNHSIDRIDNNRGYCPSNCRWATLTEQMSNTRKNHLITYGGKTKHLAELGREFNLCPHTLRARIIRGWSIEKALMTPVRKKRKN